VECTGDGVVASGTVFVQFSGGREAPLHLELAPTLIVIHRVYPLEGFSWDVGAGMSHSSVGEDLLCF
jgi:hypothetical protein